MNSKFRLLLIFYCFSLLQGISQIRGYIFSTEEKQPVPFVNIAVAGKQVGFTASKNGSFEIPASLGADTLIFSSIGYETLRNLGSQIGDTLWMEIEFELLKEVVVLAAEDKQFETDLFKKKEVIVSFGSNNIPTEIATFYPFREINNEFPFITNIKILTRCDIRRATFSMTIVGADSNGLPLNSPIAAEILKAKKGTKFISHTFTKPILVPENGYFIVLKALHIKDNIYAFKFVNEETGEISSGFQYSPSFCALPATDICCDSFINRDGEWKVRRVTDVFGRVRLAISTVYSN